MELYVDRIYKGEKYTIGKLYINGKYICDTIEDKVRNLTKETDKIKGSTAISKGRYKVILSYSPHFQRVLPELLNVPYFTNIRIHNGNDENDSSGCIIVGYNKIKGKVINSKLALNKLMAFIESAVEQHEEIYITID